MARWDDLPAELLFSALESLSSPNRGATPNYASLIACSLVCKPWSGCAQALLFRRISPRTTTYSKSSRHSTSQLLAALTAGTLRGTALARQVRALKLQIGIDIHYRGDGDQHADLQSVATLLNACVNLRELSVTQSALAPPGNVFNAAQMQLILDHPSIRHLDLRADCNPPAIMYQLLHAWPCLRTLDISAWTVNPAPAHLRPRCSLTTVSAGTYGDPSALLEAAAPAVAELTCGLNSLACVEPVSRTLRTLVIDCAFPLRTLADEARATLALASCVNLQQVEVRGVTACPAALLEAMPMSVDRLRLHCAVDATRLANLLRVRPGLRHVEVEVVTLQHRHAFADLHQLCRSQNVRLNRMPVSESVSVF